MPGCSVVQGVLPAQQAHMSAAENRKLFLAVLVILEFRSEIVRSAQVYLSSGQVGAFFRLALNIWDRVQASLHRCTALSQI